MGTRRRESALGPVVVRHLLAASLLLLLLSPPTIAAPIVTFYNDRASFQAVCANPHVVDFEGIVPDNETAGVGKTFQSGPVTFSSPVTSFGANLLVFGKNAQTSGSPFDSAVLAPFTSSGSQILATLDPAAGITAAGAQYMNRDATRSLSATLRLFGPDGLLDTRTITIGPSAAGHPPTFFGYTVFGDTVSSLSLSVGGGVGPAVDNFTTGAALAPLPPAAIPAALTVIAALGFASRRLSPRTLPARHV